MTTDNNIVVSIRNVVTRLPEFRFSESVNLEIRKGEQWAIIGPNGAGKTVLANILQRKYAFKEGEVVYKSSASTIGFIKSITFKDIYQLADFRNSYYQQRWHATETTEMPLVEDLFTGITDKTYLQELLSLFGIEYLLTKKIIFLSSGELRKFLIVHTLVSNPGILILDNPFIGLDTSSRMVLVEMLEKMTRIKDLQIILLLSNPADIPSMITHVLPVRNKTVYPAMLRRDFLDNSILLRELFPDTTSQNVSLPLKASNYPKHSITFRMEHVSIRYGERTILSGLDWEVKNGDKWALSGPNGAGKSTLLSLVFADNPQGYANTIYLFDRKRGSGESIWDIKKRIGYVSPEIHLYYNENVPALQIVSSGFFDSIGLYRKCNAEQEEQALQWMNVFGVGHLKEQPFLTLSSGEQRLVLLARAFVKNPDLLILDEPIHGLDICNKNKTAQIIEQFCNEPDKTLIYVTHYLHELPSCIDKRFELKKLQ
ncbi:MAG: ATP-binding cassette domain-containing protein [Tannerellaceae bacterium]|jgi:molybdate transport system ATP-binding protein|nr:ATP-binding cassette domain-containing protein [Tannerellaceae bacterium]